MSSKSYPKVTEGFVQHMIMMAYPAGYATYHNYVSCKQKKTYEKTHLFDHDSIPNNWLSKSRFNKTFGK